MIMLILILGLLSPASGRGWERGLHEFSMPPLLASPPSGGEEYEEKRRTWKSALRYDRSTLAGEVVWLAMLIRPCEGAGAALRGGTPMAARSLTALTSALRRIRL